MAISKAAANKKYDELRAQLKAGTIDKNKFKTAADRIYKMYHSDSNKATRNAAPKPKPQASTPSKPKASTPKPKPKTSSSSSPKPKPKSTGTQGTYRPSNPPSPTVRRRGSTTGATVDPRERSVRRNRAQAARPGSTAGRRNINRQVQEQSGSKKRDNTTAQSRRRRAREEGLRRNRREMLARRNNDM